MNLLKFLKKRVIRDCEKREPYLTRYFIVKNDLFAIYIHQFHKSDEGYYLHDHPRSFLTIIIKGGYYEELRTNHPSETSLTWRKPGTVLYRKADTPHRVELYGKECWTLVFLFPRWRRWGFYTDNGWEDSESYLGKLDCLN